MSGDEEKRVTLRMPAELCEAVAAQAVANDRSMNGEIVACLRAGCSLRDDFAGLALVGLLAGTPTGDAASSWARTAYDIADAMLAERAKR